MPRRVPRVSRRFETWRERPHEFAHHKRNIFLLSLGWNHLLQEPRAPEHLVQLTAPPVAIPFASVGEARRRHVEKERLAANGLTIDNGRAVLRRVHSLQQGSWLQDTGIPLAWSAGSSREWSSSFELF